MFAKAKFPTPVLNTPHFESVFGGDDRQTLLVDEKGLLRAVETIALAETKFKVVDHLGGFIARVEAQEYPSPVSYVDTRFLEPSDQLAPERKIRAAKAEAILERMHALLGSAYIWGGNWSAGIPQMLAFYPPGKELDRPTQEIWSLQGVDCSGLLYEATDGLTPRNTSQLIYYGSAVPVQGKTLEKICSQLRPLDMVVWPGHVFFVSDGSLAIESRYGRGTITTPLKERFEELLTTRTPIDNPYALDSRTFVIRRFTA
jgi:hypothetical protein